MDLLNLIGDSRTDSLPAGFLRSVKMKYKQESSRVFPPGTPYYKEDGQGTEACKRAASAASIQSTPSFMSWKIPPRLIHCNGNTQLPQTPLPATGLDGERAKLSSRLSVARSISGGSQKLLPVSQEKLHSGRETLPRLYSSHSAPSIASSGKFPCQSLPAMAHQQERNTTNKVTGKDLKNIEKAMNANADSNAADAINKWLQTATEKEQAIALKFFSSLTGTKPEKSDKGSKKPHNHTERECEMCDTERIIEQTLQTLARNGATVSRGKLQYNPRRKPDLSKQSHYYTPKRLPPHVHQQFQTWHHLPIYTVPRDAAINKSSMFTQPHCDYGRHFSIHPEWGLHKPLVL